MVAESRPAVALRCQVADASLHAYMQQHPFLTGPSEDSNRRALAALRAGIRVVEHAAPGTIERRPHQALMLTPPENAAARALLKATGMGDAELRHAELDYSWRAAPLPHDCADILCLGSGTGEELAFLRARAPAARIVVWDYVAKLRPGLAQAVQAQFVRCDLVAELRARTQPFDAVFSNHTLEHLYDPDTVLPLLWQHLRPGGLLLAGLPLDGDDSVPFHDAVGRMGRDAAKLHDIDLGIFDAGHPWKTNAADLCDTLARSGFVDVRIAQRSDAPYRSAGLAATPSRLPLPVLQAAHALTFAPARAVLRRLFRHGTPLALRRALVALERRLAFGAGRLKNGFAPDVRVCARRDG